MVSIQIPTEHNTVTIWILDWYSNGRFVCGCQMVRYLNGGLKTGLKKACLWSKMSGIQMVHQFTWLHHLNAGHPYCPVFRLIRYSGVGYSDGYCITFFAGDEEVDVIQNLFSEPQPVSSSWHGFCLCSGPRLFLHWPEINFISKL